MEYSLSCSCDPHLSRVNAASLIRRLVAVVSGTVRLCCLARETGVSELTPSSVRFGVFARFCGFWFAVWSVTRLVSRAVVPHLPLCAAFQAVPQCPLATGHWAMAKVKTWLSVPSESIGKAIKTWHLSWLFTFATNCFRLTAFSFQLSAA